MRLLPVTLLIASFASSAVNAASPSVATSTPAPAAASAGEAAGGVSLAVGSVTDTAADGSTRQLKDGDEVYPGDSFVLGDDSYLDIDFTDGGRILLRPGTTFQIQQYHFEPEAHPGADGSPAAESAPAQSENAFFSLLKGGLRALDGLIGHTQPRNYAVATPVATIGVRGTSFDARYCGDDCQDEADASGAPQNGLYTAVSDGSIGVKNGAGEQLSKAGEYGYVASRQAAPVRKATAPRALRHMALPEKFKARDEKNRAAVKARQQQRRAHLIQRRAQQKPGSGSTGERRSQGIPAERREQRREEMQQRREQMQERREQQEHQQKQEEKQAPAKENCKGKKKRRKGKCGD